MVQQEEGGTPDTESAGESIHGDEASWHLHASSDSPPVHLTAHLDMHVLTTLVSTDAVTTYIAEAAT